MPSIALPRSSASLSSGDEVPHIFTRKSRLKPGKFLITSAKRLLQQNLPQADVSRSGNINVWKVDYSITSSASASRVGGIVMPSDRAVLRLMTNSNLIGRSIGRSDGLAPLRILETYGATR